MHYIVTEIQTGAEGAVTPVAEAFAERAQAEFRYHTVLAYAAVSELPRHAAVLMQSDGMLLARECYEHPQPEPEPEPVEVEPETNPEPEEVDDAEGNDA